MPQPLTIVNTVVIQAPASRVWTVLTDERETPKYMFGCRTVSDWQAGSLLEWKMELEGREITAVTGHILELEAGRLLVYTVFDPNSSLPDIPANYLTVTYSLKDENDDTVLTVTQGDYATVADGERRYQETYNNGEGWKPILEQIKKVAEARP